MQIDAMYNQSAADHMPAPLLGLVADARPAVLLICQQVLRALEVGHHIGALGLGGLGAGLHCQLDVGDALHGQGLGAVGIEGGQEGLGGFLEMGDLAGDLLGQVEGGEEADCGEGDCG